MISLSIDSSAFDGLDRYLSGLEEAISAGIERAAQQVARKIHSDAKRTLKTKVYDVPIPILASAMYGEEERGFRRARYRKGARKGLEMKALSPGALAKLAGKAGAGQYGRWERTGELLASEGYAVERVDRHTLRIRLVNSSGHAKARRDLGTPGHRRSGEQSGKSPTRSVQWQDEAAAVNRAYMREAFRRELEEVLRHMTS